MTKLPEKRCSITCCALDILKIGHVAARLLYWGRKPLVATQHIYWSLVGFNVAPQINDRWMVIDFLEENFEISVLKCHRTNYPSVDSNPRSSGV